MGAASGADLPDVTLKQFFRVPAHLLYHLQALYQEWMIIFSRGLENLPNSLPPSCLPGLCLDGRCKCSRYGSPLSCTSSVKQRQLCTSLVSEASPPFSMVN